MTKVAMLSAALFAAVSLNADLILESGPYRVVLSVKDHFSIAQIYFDGYEIGTRTGYYGTILAPERNMFIGSGHTEGGEEKVQSIEISVDGKNVDQLSGEIRGDEIVFDKVTLLDNLLVTIKTVINRDGIRIDKQWKALEEQKIFSFYIFQYCWNAETDVWMLGRPDGSVREGIFKSDNGWHLRGDEREILWHAVYSTAAQKGIISYFSKYFPGQGRYMSWDRANYHKFYFWSANPPVVPAGYQSPEYSIVLKGLGASENWRDEVKRVAAELTALYPLPPPPDEVRLAEYEEGIVLKGNGKFLVHKIPLVPATDSRFDFSFELRKSAEGCSERPHDNQVLFAQHDQERKFHIFAGAGGNIPRDGKWHEVKGAFSTPAALHDFNIFIYNSNSQGTVSIRNIRIKKAKGD